MREILLLTVVYGSLPFALYRPFFGLAVFSWLAYMRPHDYAWLSSPERLSLIVALTMLVGLVLRIGQERFLTLRPLTVLLGLLGLWFAITGFTAVDPLLSSLWIERFLKIMLISILTTGIVRSEFRFRALMIVITFSLGLLGLKMGLFGLVRGGAYIHQGPGGFLGDNNSLALAFAMTVPLLAAVAAGERSRWLRRLAVLLVPFTVLCIVFTMSRGGLLTLGVVSALIVLRSGRPFLATLLIVLSLAGFVTLTTESFQEDYVERARSTVDYETDESALGRIVAWETALSMSRDYPIFGVGPDNFLRQYPKYGHGKARVTHNAFLQFLAENGWPALILYVTIIVMTLWTLERQRHGDSPLWVRGYASGIQISILGYVVGSLFLDMAYFDLFYHLVALTVCLQVIAPSAARSEIEDVPAGETVELPWWKQPRQPERGHT